jgi:hypothetical protein
MDSTSSNVQFMRLLLVCMILVIRVGIPWLTFNVEK